MKGFIAIGFILAIMGMVLGTIAILNPLGICYRGTVSFNSIGEYHAFAEKVENLPEVGGFTNNITVTEISKPEIISVFYRISTPIGFVWMVPFDSQTEAVGYGAYWFLLAVVGMAFIIAGIISLLNEGRSKP